MIKRLCQIWIFAVSDEQLGTNGCLIYFFFFVILWVISKKCAIIRQSWVSNELHNFDLYITDEQVGFLTDKKP